MNTGEVTRSALLHDQSESREHLGLAERFSDFIIISVQAFTQRDLNRFGATWLLNHAKRVHLVDLSLLVWEKAAVADQHDAVEGVLRPRNWYDVEWLLSQYENKGLLIPYVTAQLAVEPLFKLMTKYSISCLFYDSGRAPHSRSVFEVIGARLRILSDPRALIRRVRKRLAPGEVIIDYLVLGGKDSEIRLKHRWIKQVRLAIPSHSYDYVAWTTASPFSNSEPYIVFLDQAYPDHPHWSKLWGVNPFAGRKYYAQIESLLRNVSDTFGMSVLIALHPRSSDSNNPKPYQEFETFQHCTASLVKGADLVVAHNSTAVSFAVLGRKPLLLVEVDERRKRSVTRNISAILGSPVVHISSRTLPSWEKLHVDESKYGSYEALYIRHPACNGIPVWDRIFGASPGRPSV